MDMLKEFERLGRRASFHFAAEIPNEDSQAYSCVHQAMEIYEEYKGLRTEMRVIAKEFLWASMFERKRDDIRDKEAI